MSEPRAASIVVAASLEGFEEAARLRAAMALEMQRDWDGQYPGWSSRFAGYFAALQRAGRSQLFLAQGDGHAVGMVLVSFLENYRGVTFDTPSAYINALYVEPGARRRQIARALMENAIAWARARNCTNVRLRTSEAGRPLYAKLGFTPTSELQLTL